MGGRVELAVELTHGDGLGVYDEILDTPLVHQIGQFEVAECVGEDLVGHRLASHWLTHYHETVPHKDHLIHLKAVQIMLVLAAQFNIHILSLAPLPLL